jgi:hypothetical protein
MAWFRKKPDPISDRARALNEEIARLELQIKQLDSRVQREQSTGRRATAAPQTTAASPPTAGAVAREGAAQAVAHEPIFEDLDRNRLKARGETANTPRHYNELGVRKYDLPAFWRRLRNHFHGPSTSNPKLVSYLAAGGIQGLRPLRYEKRVARNRVIALAVILFFTFLGIILVYSRHRL